MKIRKDVSHAEQQRSGERPVSFASPLLCLRCFRWEADDGA
jgi:hypothetical protein